jgi:hypothetical protein
MKEKETKGKIGKNFVNTNVDEATPVISKGTKQLTAYEIFEKCIERAENLVSLESSTKKVKGITKRHYCDCYRAAIVLSISALDAFIRKIVISGISEIVANNKKSLNDKLKRYITELLNQDKLLEAARNYNIIETVECAVKEDFVKKSFQGEWKISSYLELVGYDNIFSQVATKANINEKNLRKDIETYTSRRHIIAHSGDYDLSQNPHKEFEITISDANNCIKVVKTFVRNINNIITEKK